MIARNFITAVFAIVLLVAGTIAVAAQTAPVSGKVELLKPDNTREAVSGALVEVYRTEVKGSLPSAKTNKKGEFSFAAFQMGNNYMLTISAPGCAPIVFPNVKAGQARLLVTVYPGDGTKWTEDEAKAALAQMSSAGDADSGKLSEEQQKAKDEYEAKVREIEAKNKKANETDAIVRKALQEGREAFVAKNYDLAVAKYEEGYNADPEFVGSAPVLLNNLGAVLKDRGADTYNKNVKNTDASARIEAYKSSKADFAESVVAFDRSLNIIKKAPTAEITNAAATEANRVAALRGAVETLRVIVQAEQVREDIPELAAAIIPAYIAIESDQTKKSDAKIILADIYRLVGDAEKSIGIYKEVIETSPDNLFALAGAGLSLINLGYINDDNAKFQEGVDLLQKYVSLAPDKHKYKADAVGLIETVKKEKKVAPQKSTPAKRKP